ncbi:ABC transporter permease [Deinococcus detaillensis]|uniref:ABC transporter permease n=1 Tax=Deinococcus detaillensis TaxID=2592048 RepID=A0A553UU24_9DEIO|nr:ABC transporter permease [Deinococcus detaillensis]TSA83726.1 ABC transporter permease [Deinococcus detaillensis]
MTTAATPTKAINKNQGQFAIAKEQFRKNATAKFGGVVLILLYLMALFGGFLAPDGLSNYSTTNLTPFHPPTPIHFTSNGGLSRPYVNNYTQQLNMNTFVNEYKATKEKCPIYFGVRGETYKILGFIPSNLHLFGTGNPVCKVYLFGGDALGRDLLSRTLYASQVSLTIGVLAVLIATVIGMAMGAISAYFGGVVDNLIQRLIEVIASIPYLFLVILLRSIFPSDLNPILVLYVILGILAFISWGGLARVVRGQLLSVREQDYVSAATALGSSNGRIMFRHMLPSMTSYLIISLSLAIPGYILLESGLSFLGIGAVEPYASWGSLLSQAQEGGFASITQRPWVLIPGYFIVATVMCFQLLGDGLRDALDPRKRQ